MTRIPEAYESAVISNAPEPKRRPLLCLRGLDLPASRLRARDERGDQDLGRRRDVLDRALERGFVRLGRLREAAQLSHKLQRRVANLRFGSRRLEVEKRLYVAAHGDSSWLIRSLRSSRQKLGERARLGLRKRQGLHLA